MGSEYASGILNTSSLETGHENMFVRARTFLYSLCKRKNTDHMKFTCLIPLTTGVH